MGPPTPNPTWTPKNLPLEGIIMGSPRQEGFYRVQVDTKTATGEGPH